MRAFVRMFKPEFASKVSSGEKLQTIRPIPKRIPEIGDQISLRRWKGKPYRSKQVILTIGTITKVKSCEIWPKSEIIAVAGIKLNFDEMFDFARSDGFSDHWEMLKWFWDEYKSYKFDGIVIYWKL